MAFRPFDEATRASLRREWPFTPVVEVCEEEDAPVEEEESGRMGVVAIMAMVVLAILPWAVLVGKALALVSRP